MGKAGRWLKSFLSVKKDRPRAEAMAVAVATPPATGPPKDKRWSFRRPGASLVEDAAAVRIQAAFRGYLARTALCALRGIVKLQALVRGQLVRKQANATLRCMQALLTAQSHLRARRMRVLQEQYHLAPPPPRPRHSPQHPRHRRSYEMDRSREENAKIVEMDIGEPARRDAAKDRHLLLEHHGRCSPAPSRQRTDALERQPSRRKGTPPRGAKMQRSSSVAGAAARGAGGQSSPWSAQARS
ncbi:protein IQ-DOMAIN 14-like [Panicum miliaceum]|uniref:Protein IQ-DOMAIN 14-like n=1 Tax=Panicum miliaceum TaxID=4540 RepID=A0A3L6SN24_PANMI|nr:protein IQ-DOMAIN 14-like [Panicum miliaceum]